MRNICIFVFFMAFVLIVFVLIVYVVIVDGGEPDNLMSHTLFRSLKKLS